MPHMPAPSHAPSCIDPDHPLQDCPTSEEEAVHGMTTATLHGPSGPYVLVNCVRYTPTELADVITHLQGVHRRLV